MSNKNEIMWKGVHQFQRDEILADWKEAKKIEVSKLGEKAIYYTSKGITYGIPYAEIRRIYKRIEGVSARLSCCKMNFDTHSIVLCSDKEQLAEIPYKDSREAGYVYNHLLSKVQGVIEGKEEK